MLKSLLPGLIILAAGIAIGAAAATIFLPRAVSAGNHPDAHAPQMMRRLSSELNLTPEQQGELDPIIQQRCAALSDIREEVRPRIVAQLEMLDADISSVLDDEQKLIWQQKVSRLEEYFPAFGERRRRGWGNGPGAGGGSRGQQLHQNGGRGRNN